MSSTGVVAGMGHNAFIIRYKTKEAADKVTDAVMGGYVNGGIFDGMRLGGQTFYVAITGYPDHYDVMC